MYSMSKNNDSAKCRIMSCLFCMHVLFKIYLFVHKCHLCVHILWKVTPTHDFYVYSKKLILMRPVPFFLSHFSHPKVLQCFQGAAMYSASQYFKSYQFYFLLQMHAMTLSLLVPLLPTSRASSVVVSSVSLADMKQRKRGRKNTFQTITAWRHGV